MNLSSDILKSFADITATKDTKKSSKIYATLVQNGNSVKLDGSNTISPLVKPISGKTGDRVEVDIKNHQITVVDNITEKTRNISEIDRRFNNIDNKLKSKKQDKTENNQQADGEIEDIDLTDIYENMEMLFTSVSNGKEKIAEAITDKGVKSSADETFEELAKDIENIQTTGNTAKTHISHRKSNVISLGVSTGYTYSLE